MNLENPQPKDYQELFWARMAGDINFSEFETIMQEIASKQLGLFNHVCEGGEDNQHQIC